MPHPAGPRTRAFSASRATKLLRRRFPVAGEGMAMAPTALLRVIATDGAESSMQVTPLRRLHEPACYQYRVAAGPVGGLPKRALGVFAAVGALILLAPFLLLVAALIRLESRGPALYRQRRTGFRG